MKKFILPLLTLLCLRIYADVSGVTFVAFDTETTGFSPASERIIEIGAVKYRDGKIIDSTHWLINPGIEVRNSRVHGIKREDLAGYPGFSDTYQAFRKFAGDAVLIAHNASFDVRFMTAEIDRNNLEPIKNPVLNSLTLFRRWFPDAESHRLVPLAATLNIRVNTAHRAEADSETLLKILDYGLKSRPGMTVQKLAVTANGTYYFDGTRKP